MIFSSVESNQADVWLAKERLLSCTNMMRLRGGKVIAAVSPRGDDTEHALSHHDKYRD